VSSRTTFSSTVLLFGLLYYLKQYTFVAYYFFVFTIHTLNFYFYYTIEKNQRWAVPSTIVPQYFFVPVPSVLLKICTFCLYRGTFFYIVSGTLNGTFFSKLNRKNNVLHNFYITVETTECVFFKKAEYKLRVRVSNCPALCRTVRHSGPDLGRPAPPNRGAPAVLGAPFTLNSLLRLMNYYV